MSDQDTLDDALSALTPDERAELDRIQALRLRATERAARLGLDAEDVFHTLRQLQRSPTDRLRRGVAQGRRRPRVSC